MVAGGHGAAMVSDSANSEAAELEPAPRADPVSGSYQHEGEGVAQQRQCVGAG